MSEDKKVYTADDLKFETKFNCYTGKTHQHAEMRFENGFGVSVITPPSYDWGKYELAVLDKDGKICYSTDIGHDVEVVFSKEELTELMSKVQNLDANGHLKENAALEMRRDRTRRRLRERDQSAIKPKAQHGNYNKGDVSPVVESLLKDTGKEPR